VYRNLQTFQSPDDQCLNCLCVLGNVLCEENTCLEDSDEENYDDGEDDEDEEWKWIIYAFNLFDLSQSVLQQIKLLFMEIFSPFN
jgi:hypothetical protein